MLEEVEHEVREPPKLLFLPGRVRPQVGPRVDLGEEGLVACVEDKVETDELKVSPRRLLDRLHRLHRLHRPRCLDARLCRRGGAKRATHDLVYSFPQPR